MINVGAAGGKSAAVYALSVSRRALDGRSTTWVVWISVGHHQQCGGGLRFLRFETVIY